VGPLPENTYQGQRATHLLTMMDGFTKWAEAVPVGETTARSVAKVFLEQWVARYGIPDQVHSDQGLQFTSDLFRSLMDLLGIRKTTTPPYNPRSNKVERLHRVLGNILRSDQTGPVCQWVQKVPMALFAYRTTVSNVTGVTPFRAVFGADSRVPLDVVFPTPPAMDKQWPEYVRDQQRRLQDIYQEMRASGQTAVGRATAYQTGRVTRANRVEVGDVVYYYCPRVTKDENRQLSRKLAILWTGPYRVNAKPSDSLVTLVAMGTWARNQREITTTVDKVRVIRGPIPEELLRAQRPVRMDELEEDLDDYGEYVRTEGAAEEMSGAPDAGETWRREPPPPEAGETGGRPEALGAPVEATRDQGTEPGRAEEGRGEIAEGVEPRGENRKGPLPRPTGAPTAPERGGTGPEQSSVPTGDPPTPARRGRPQEPGAWQGRLRTRTLSGPKTGRPRAQGYGELAEALIRKGASFKRFQRGDCPDPAYKRGREGENREEASGKKEKAPLEPQPEAMEGVPIPDSVLPELPSEDEGMGDGASEADREDRPLPGLPSDDEEMGDGGGKAGQSGRINDETESRLSPIISSLGCLI